MEMGAPELFEEMRRELVSKGWILDAHKRIAECPGCLKTFENDYPDIDLELIHSTQFLTRLRSMNLKKEDLRVTYHDPCHLGRGLGIYEETRAILKKVADIKEMKREKEQAWCCGSGGGVKSAFDDFAL